MKEIELDKTFRDVVFLIYNDRCIWEDTEVEGVPCGGWLELSHLISRSNKYFRWDLNNAVPMCKNHHDWWHGKFKGHDSLLRASQKLRETHVSLSDFMITNKSTRPMFKPDLEALSSFLVENAPEAIKKGEAPFPSLYGRFDN